MLAFGDLICVADSHRACSIVPIAPANLNAIATNVRAQEPEVHAGQTSTLANNLRDLRDLLSNDCIEAGCGVVSILAANVTSEVGKMGVDLLNDATGAEFDISDGLGTVSKPTYTV